MIGHTISHYKITEKLGEGGMGVVYKAEDTKLDRPVALKFLAPHLLRDDEARKRFEREAKAAARLDHPNICTVYEIDEAEGRTFIVMAFLEGRPLSARIKEGPLKLPEALSVAIQTAEGLEAAHEKGITHRDIKPDNLMLMTGSRGLVKVMDFGLAQLAGGSKFTREGTTLGTMTYMSPEQAAGAETDSRTDIWSLGVVLYEMVAGQPPFRGDYDQVVVYSLMNEDPEPLTAVRTGVPKELERIVNKCLAKEPGERYQRVDELLVDLRGLQKEQQVEAATRARPAPAAAQASHRTPWLLAGAAVLVALAVTAAAFLGLFESEKPVAEQPLEAVPLTSYPGREEHPTFSPDGARVAFAWNGESQDNFDIYVKEIDSDNREMLTTDPADDTAPAWSPDGRFIAFLRQDPAEDKSKVVIIPSIGGPERVVGDAVARHYPGAPDRTAAWTPDSKQLVVVDRSSPDEPGALFFLSIDTGETQRLTSPADAWGTDASPAFSPDGKTLAFIRGASVFTADVFLLSLNPDLSPAGEPRRLTAIGNILSALSWSGEGESIVFSGGDFGNARLYKIPISGGDAQLVGVAGLGSISPAISGPARRLAYAGLTSDWNVWAIRVGTGGGPDPVRLLASTRIDSAAYYSPDGKQITFTSDRTGTTGIWLSDADGSNLEPVFLHPEGAFSGSGRFSPDGGHIAFDSYPDRNADIFVISAAGGEPFRLTSHSANDQVPSWSGDGTWVYFGSERTGRFEIWKAPAGGGEPVQVTTDGGHFALEDPVGEFLYYVKRLGVRNAALWKMPVSGGEESKVLESVVARNFAVALGGIYFMQAPDEHEPDGAYSIRFLNLADGRVEIIARLPRNTVQLTQGLDVSPDGQSILYTQVDDISSDLMLIEGFE